MKVTLTQTRIVNIQINRSHAKFQEEFEEYFSGSMDELYREVVEDPSYFGMFGGGELDWLHVTEADPILTDEVTDISD